MKYLLTTLLFMLLFTVISNSQPPKQDELGCATKESKTLNFLVGKWKVKSNFRVSRRDNKWEKTEGVSKITHLFKDCVFQEILTGKRNARFHQFTGLYSFNNLSDKLQWVGGHSEHGVLTLYEGNFDNGKLIFKHDMDLRGRKVYFQIVIEKTENGFKIRSERSIDQKEWDAGWYMEYTAISGD